MFNPFNRKSLSSIEFEIKDLNDTLDGLNILHAELCTAPLCLKIGVRASTELFGASRRQSALHELSELKDTHTRVASHVGELYLATQDPLQDKLDACSH